MSLYDSLNYFCDYCSAELEHYYLRAVGFTRLSEGSDPAPLVRSWCGECAPDDEIDEAAHEAVIAAFDEVTYDDRTVTDWMPDESCISGAAEHAGAAADDEGRAEA